MQQASEPRLVTSDEFVADIIYALRLRGEETIELTDNGWDKQFSAAFADLWDAREEQNLVLDFNMVPDRYHGDSSVVREALYSLRERKVVAINNPDFVKVTLQVPESAATRRLERSSIGRAFVEGLVAKHFPAAESAVELERAGN